MQEKLKKCAQKSLMWRVIISLIIIIACLVISKFGIFYWIMGPTPITDITKLSEMEGKYVSYEASYVLSEYVRGSSKNTETNVEKLVDIGYIVYHFDEEGEGAADTFFGAVLPAKYETEMDTMIDETWAWMYWEIDEVSASRKITGTLEPLTGLRLQYFNETLEEMGIDETMQDNVIPLAINTDKINGAEGTAVFILSAVALGALIYLIYSIICFASAAYMKNVKKYLAANPTVTEPHIDADMSAAKTVSNNIWVGKRWTIFISGMKANIIENKNIVWAYYYRRTGRYSESKVKTFDINKKMVAIDASKADSDIILECYSNEQPQVVVGYDKEWEKTYNKDFQTFLGYRYNAAKQQAEEESFGYGNDTTQL